MNYNSSNRENNRMTEGYCSDLERMPIAMAYVPWQRFERTYDLNQALQVGTIFPELNKPFTGKGGNY